MKVDGMKVLIIMLAVFIALGMVGASRDRDRANAPAAPTTTATPK